MKTILKIKNMKILVKIIFGILITLTFSCNKKPSNEIELTKKNISENVYSLENLSKIMQSSVRISCSGGCNCGVEGTSTLDGPGEVHCSCDDCSMDIEFLKTKNVSINKEKLLNTITNLDLYSSAFNDIKKYAKDAYDTNISYVDKIEFNTNGKTVILTLFFTDKNNVQNSVLYSETFSSSSQGSKMVNKKYRIDCTGSCGCREQYHFGTNTASCSCDDCVMDVEEIK